MRIQQINVNFVRLPLEEPLVGAPYMPGMLREFFTVQVQTDEGIEGIGVTGFGGKLVRALKAAIEDFGELIRGDDPLRTEQVTAKLRAASASCGSGIATLAISIGHRVEGLGLGWLEDPTTCDDYQGLAKIADALTTPICAGEYLWGIEPQRQAMSRHAVDITMIDLLRVGGVTQWMKVAGMAEAFNKPVASHLLPEIHVHLVAAVPNGLVVEYMPWTWRLFDNPPMPVNGEMTVPTGPGLGLKFAPDLFDKYGIS